MRRSVRRRKRRIPLAPAGHVNRSRDRLDGHAETLIVPVRKRPGLYPGEHPRWRVLREEYRLPPPRHRLFCTVDPPKRRAIGEHAREIDVARPIKTEIEAFVVARATNLNQPFQLS